MSLKHFHVFFIAFAALFSGGFGAWALLGSDLPLSLRAMGAFSAALAVALAGYGIWFRRKASKVIT